MALDFTKNFARKTAKGAKHLLTILYLSTFLVLVDFYCYHTLTVSVRGNKEKKLNFYLFYKKITLLNKSN